MPGLLVVEPESWLDPRSPASLFTSLTAPLAKGEGDGCVVGCELGSVLACADRSSGAYKESFGIDLSCCKLKTLDSAIICVIIKVCLGRCIRY